MTWQAALAQQALEHNGLQPASFTTDLFGSMRFSYADPLYRVSKGYKRGNVRLATHFQIVTTVNNRQSYTVREANEQKKKHHEQLLTGSITHM